MDPTGGSEARIPMVVLGGWLGAGKTTLVNRLLRAVDGERIAVVVNDIGEVNLDVELIAARDGDTVELTNGCVCCTIGESLAVTLRDLVMAGKSLDGSGSASAVGSGATPFDRLVIEASGVAEPDRVAAYGDRRRIRLDGIVVVVDATDVVRRAADPTYGPLVVRQVRAADLLVLTKADLALDGGLAAVAWCADVAPDVPVVIADSPDGADPAGSDHWVRSVLGSPAAGTPTTEVAESEEDDRDAGSSAPGTVVDLPVETALDLPVETAVWRASGPVDVDRLATALGDLRTQVGSGLLRAKAVVVSLDGTPIAIHLAAGLVDVGPVPGSASGLSQPSGSLVLIAAPGVLGGIDLEATFGVARQRQEIVPC